MLFRRWNDWFKGHDDNDLLPGGVCLTTVGHGCKPSLEYTIERQHFGHTFDALTAEQ